MKPVVIVTGGTKGLGGETSRAFAHAGYFVVALYASDEKSAGEFTTVLEKGGGQGIAVRHDICSDDDSIWQRPEIQNAGKIALVHNACAPFSPVPLHQLRWQDFEQNFQVAVKGGWSCAQALIRPMLKKENGVIVNVLSSVIEGDSPKGFAAYATAKHALRGLTLALATEYGVKGVRVFSVSPGFMDTTLTRQWDERLRDVVRSASRISESSVAAAKIVALVDSKTTAGRGEDYPI